MKNKPAAGKPAPLGVSAAEAILALPRETKRDAVLRTLGTRRWVNRHTGSPLGVTLSLRPDALQ